MERGGPAGAARRAQPAPPPADLRVAESTREYRRSERLEVVSRADAASRVSSWAATAKAVARRLFRGCGRTPAGRATGPAARCRSCSGAASAISRSAPAASGAAASILAAAAASALAPRRAGRASAPSRARGRTPRRQRRRGRAPALPSVRVRRPPPRRVRRGVGGVPGAAIGVVLDACGGGERAVDFAAGGRVRRPVHVERTRGWRNRTLVSISINCAISAGRAASSPMPRCSAARLSTATSPIGSAAAASRRSCVSIGSASRRRRKLCSIWVVSSVCRAARTRRRGRLGSARGAARAAPAGCPASPPRCGLRCGRRGGRDDRRQQRAGILAAKARDVQLVEASQQMVFAGLADGEDHRDALGQQSARDERQRLCRDPVQPLRRR